MKNTYLNIAAALITGLSLAGPVAAETADFVGEWVNVDAETRGITRFVLSETVDDDVLKIEVFGKCHPSDCVWGEEALALYGANVSDGDYQFGSARYEKNYADTILTMEFMDDGRITLDSFTEFLDGSNRHNYHSYDTFRKKEPTVARCPDLTVAQIKNPVYLPGTGTSIEAVIKNIGTQTAGLNYARLQDGSTVRWARVPELAPGATFNAKFVLPYWVFNPDADFSITVDYTKLIDECNENNNVKEFHQIG